MATQRYISTSFWDDEWIHGLDPSEKLLYLYLMTNTLTNIAGVYKITLARMCFDTGFNENTMRHLLDKFEKAGKACLFKGYIIIPSWPKHQQPEDRPKVKQGIDRILKELDKVVLDHMVSIGYRYHIEGYPYPTNYSDLDSDLDLDSDSDSDSDFSPVAPIDDFDPQPNPPAVPAVAGRGNTPTRLFTALRNAFQSKNPTWPKPDQEVQALYWLVTAAEAKAKDLRSSPADCALVLVTKFWELRQNGRDFWRRQPFQPTRMKALWGDLMAEIEKAGSLDIDDGSWLDAYREGA